MIVVKTDLCVYLCVCLCVCVDNYFLMSHSKFSHSLALIVAHWKISVFKRPEIEASRLRKVTSN